MFWIFQIKALSAGLENLILVSEEIQRKTFAIGNKGGGGVNTGKQQWKLGEFEFEAVMRQLDNAVSIIGIKVHSYIML